MLWAAVIASGDCRISFGLELLQSSVWLEYQGDVPNWVIVVSVLTWWALLTDRG
jgi:hypothetical protein